MNRTKWWSVAGVLLLFCGVSHASVIVKLGVEPATTLPHLPVTFRIEIRNVGTESVVVPTRGVLQVQKADGSRFLAYPGGQPVGSTVAVLADGSAIELDPGESTDLTVYAALDMKWICDKQLMAPGQYQLQLVLSEEFRRSMPERDTSDVVDTLRLTDFMASTTVDFRVEDPTGVDANVHALVNKHPCDWPDLDAVKIWAEFPTSRYAAYAPPIPPLASNEATIEALTRALERNPIQSVADVFEYTIATRELAVRPSVSSGSMSVESAMAAVQRGKKILLRLSKQAVDPNRRLAAESKLDDVPSREELERLAALARGERIWGKNLGSDPKN